MNIKDNFNITKRFTIPNILTLLNLSCGVASIFLTTQKEFKIAAILIIVAVLFDFLDGKAARYLKSTTPFGMQLDSLSDLISFGVAPTILAFQTTTNIGQGFIFAAIIYVFFVCAGALRLARYNITRNSHGFEGMPITVNGILIPIIYFLGITSWYPLVMLISAIFMISSFKIKRYL